MADFNKAIKPLLNREGGDKITNDPNDAGGLTKWGITLGDYKAHGADLDGNGVIDGNDLRLVNEQQADDYYDKNYWDKLYLDTIISQAVAEKIFDNGVNLGIGAITKILQTAIGATIDGRMGPNTVFLANQLNEKDLMDKLVNAQINYYWSITINNINKKALIPINQGGLGWSQGLFDKAISYCNNRDLNSIDSLNKTIKVMTNTLQGNIRFIHGWLNRANERFGV